MPGRLSFAQMRTFLAAAAGDEKRAFVGTVAGEIVLSVNFSFAPAAAPRKRRRGDAEAVQAEVDRVRRCTDASDDLLAAASEAALALTEQSGSSGERVIESWGLSAKTQQPPANANLLSERPALVLSARISPGVAVSVSGLKQALGTCFADGMLVVGDSAALPASCQLPVGEHAAAALAAGQTAATLICTVCENNTVD